MTLFIEGASNVLFRVEKLKRGIHEHTLHLAWRDVFHYCVPVSPYPGQAQMFVSACDLGLGKAKGYTYLVGH